MAFWVAIVLSTLAVCLSLAGGAENFNAETHICCNGTVSVKGANSGCCGSQAFDITDSACCGDKVVPFPPGLDGPFGHGCCYASSGSAKPYDTNTHECCDGDVLEKPDKDVFYGCCSGQLFDYTTQLCCGDKILERREGDECCGDKVYNISRQICCEQWGVKEEKWSREYSDIFDRKGEHSYCCGQAVFDVAAEVCCNDKVLVKPAHLPPNSAGCCGDEILDHQSQICCQTLKNESGVFMVADSKLREKTGPSSRCCGVDVFNYHEQVCCNETILSKPKGMDKETWGTCCGDQVMASFEFQLCDNGRLVERNSTNMWACGNKGKMFDISTQTCCFGEVLEDADGMECCHLASKPYNKKKENCCGDKIVPLTQEDINGGKLACCAPFPNFLTFMTPARP